MRLDGYEWRGPIPSSNYRQGGMPAQAVGLIIHKIDGSLASADVTFHTDGIERSAHVGHGRDGARYQWVDTANVAYAQCQGNYEGYVSVENEGGEDDVLTDVQILDAAALANRLNVPAKACRFQGDTGIGYHKQFPGDCDSAWGRTSCPGDGIVAQIPAIIAAMQLAPTPEGDDVLYTATIDGKLVWYRDAKGILVPLGAQTGAYYTAVASGQVARIDLGGLRGVLDFNKASIDAFKAAGIPA